MMLDSSIESLINRLPVSKICHRDHVQLPRLTRSFGQLSEEVWVGALEVGAQAGIRPGKKIYSDGLNSPRRP